MRKNLFNRIGFVNLLSPNSKALISFFKDKVGLEQMDSQNDTDNWYGFKTGKTTFAIEPLSNRKDFKFKYNKHNQVLIQFLAKDINHFEAMNKQLKDNGVNIVRQSVKSHYGMFTNFLDTDGNLFEILLAK